MVVVALQSFEFTSAYINCSFYICCIMVRKLQYLKPPKYLFPFYQLQTVWIFWSTQFPLAFGAFSKGRSQRAAKSFLTFMLSFVKPVTSRHMLMMLSATFRSWCINSMLWGSINALHKGVPKDNFYVFSCDFHRNLQKHYFLTPSSHRAFPLYLVRVFALVALF
jgi:hypothetical protein